MSRRLMALVSLCALVCVAPALAAHHDTPTLARITFWTAAGDGFEDGLAAHNAFHAAQGDPSAHYTWQIVDGKRAGTYVRGSFGHTWASFDDVDADFAAADEADSAETLDPHIATANPQLWNTMVEHSRFPDGGGPSAMAQLTFFRVRPGMSPGFIRAIAAIKAAADTANWEGRWIWYELVSGGYTPTFVIVLPADNWAGMAGPEKSFPEMMMEVEGQEGLVKIMGILSDTIESQWTETSVLREDLSHIPSGDEGGAEGDM